MSSPTYNALIALMFFVCLGGCGGDAGSSAPEQGKSQTASKNDGKVECALAGSDSFERTCSTEQIALDGGIMLVIRHPDGGFRRFNILTDGRGLAPADGFDITRIALLDNNMILLSSGDDKYRLPALIKGDIATGTSDGNQVAS